jgi:manganese/zinc/iron transport system substrate-binding protein
MACRHTLWILAAALACLLAEAGPARAEEDHTPYRIVATVGMITDTVRQVAGDRAEVAGLMGEGIDPHLYKPTRSDIARLMKADVIFYNGLLLEGKMTDSLVRAATSGKRVHAVTELLEEQYLMEPEEMQGHYDPHVWMDPSAWAKSVEVIRDALIAFDPDGEAVYTTNAEATIERVLELDAYAEEVLGSVPDSRGSRGSAPRARPACRTSSGWLICWSAGRSARCSSSPRCRSGTSTRWWRGPRPGATRS